MSTYKNTLKKNSLNYSNSSYFKTKKNQPQVLKKEILTSKQNEKIQSKILLFATTFPKLNHLQMIEECWGKILQEMAQYFSPDVLVFLGGHVQEDTTLLRWHKAVANLPTNSSFHYEPFNPGYAPGAMRAMAMLIQRKWHSKYDWIIRVNPDVLLSNVKILSIIFKTKSEHVDAILAQCLPKQVKETESSLFLRNTAIHTDFFAIKASKIQQHFFNDWKSWQYGAEKQATRDFSEMCKANRCAWIQASGNNICRIRNNGIIHQHGNCSEILNNVHVKDHNLDNMLVPCTIFSNKSNHMKKLCKITSIKNNNFYNNKHENSEKLQESYRSNYQCLEFVHITKTAGTAIEAAAAEQNIIWGACHHIPHIKTCQGIKTSSTSKINNYLWHDHRQKYKCQNLFTIVRNPYTRIVSEFYCPWNGYRGNNQTRRIFNNWIQRSISTAIQQPSNSNGHLTPASKYVFDKSNLRRIRHVLKYENLSSDFESLMQQYNLPIRLSKHKINSSKKRQLFSIMDFDNITLQAINAFYLEDFTNFGYEMKLSL